MKRYTSRGTLHVDHVDPIADGFKNSVPEIVVGSPVNCQLVTESKNVHKGATPGQSQEDLLSRYEKFVAQCPEWAELERILANTGTLKGAINPRTRHQHAPGLRSLMDHGPTQEEAVRDVIERAKTDTRKEARRRRRRGTRIVFQIEFGEDSPTDPEKGPGK